MQIVSSVAFVPMETNGDAPALLKRPLWNQWRRRHRSFPREFRKVATTLLVANDADANDDETVFKRHRLPKDVLFLIFTYVDRGDAAYAYVSTPLEDAHAKIALMNAKQVVGGAFAFTFA
jgi:hypothetical protein